MTNEQREVMKCLADRKEMDLIEVIRTFKREGIENFAVVRKEYLDTALSLIKEQQEEIEKKDKQIDLMAEIFYKRFKAELLLEYGFENEDQLKQYFAGLVEKE